MGIYEIIRIDDSFLYGGETKDGKPNGKGILKYYSNGKCDSKYIGEFKDGKREGEGIWNMFDGSCYVGEWKLDKFHGRGKLIYQDNVQEGYWFMGRFECHYGDEIEHDTFVKTKRENIT